MKRLIFILLLLCQKQLVAQEKYVVDTADYKKRQDFLKEFDASNLVLLQELEQNQEKKVYKLLKKNLEEFKTDFSKEIKEKNFHFDERLVGLLNEILEEFKSKNPEIPKYTKVLVSKSPVLNAYCLPDGTFVVNIGMFHWLENEDQVACVLAHEISHKILNHSIKTQLKRINDDLNENNKKIVKEIKNQKYNKTQKAFDLFKSRLYATGELRRKNEYQADSLGYVILKKTKYNKFDFIETLKLLEKYDTLHPKGLSKDIYKKMFDLPNQPFKENWLKVEDFSSYNYDLLKDKINKDSVASHPEIADRITKMITNFPELKNPVTNKPTENFKNIEKIAYFNLIPNLIFSEDYGVGVYICLSRIEKNKDVELHKKLLGEGFKKIYQARKEYKLNRYLDRIDPKNQSESYIQFLSFMWNLSLDEIKNIADFYN